MKFKSLAAVAVAVAVAAATSAAPTAAQTAAPSGPLKIMIVDPLSGPQSLVMERVMKNAAFVAKRENEAGGVLGRRVEFVTCDSKFNPRDGRNCVDRAIADGIRYIFQGIGSNVSLAVLDAIDKHNERNPGRELMFINWAGQDEEMTNEHCSYWQFRTEASMGMKMTGLVRWLAADSSIKRAYLINMDFATGRSAASNAKARLQELRPDIEIVGEELHPANKVQDFIPYVSKIQAARPDVVITSNVGPDLQRLIRAGNDTGLQVRWLTTYGSMYGTIPQIGEKAVGRVFQASDTVLNMGDPEIDTIVEAAMAGGFGELENLRFYRAWAFLAAAMRKAGSDEPAKVARALEGLTIRIGGIESTLRADDHQALMPINISVMSADVKYTQENTRWSFKSLGWVPAEQVTRPTTCRMKRPT